MNTVLCKLGFNKEVNLTHKISKEFLQGYAPLISRKVCVCVCVCFFLPQNGSK